jgi:hypothetical protein
MDGLRHGWEGISTFDSEERSGLCMASFLCEASEEVDEDEVSIGDGLLGGGDVDLGSLDFAL